MKRLLYIWLSLQLLFAIIFLFIYWISIQDINDQMILVSSDCIPNGPAAYTAFTITDNLSTWFVIYAVSSIFFTIYSIWKIKLQAGHYR